MPALHKVGTPVKVRLKGHLPSCRKLTLRFSSASALMQLPRARRPLLMLIPWRHVASRLLSINEAGRGKQKTQIIGIACRDLLSLRADGSGAFETLGT